MSKKRVFLVFYNLGLGGVQTKMIDLANTMVASGVNCWVLLEERGLHDRINLLDKRVKVIVFLDYKIFRQRFFRQIKFIFFVLFAAILYRPNSIFISMCTLATRLVFLFSLLAPVFIKRIVINEDTFPSLEFSYDKVNWGRQLISKTHSRVKRVIAVSRDTYQDLSSVYKIAAPVLMYLPNWTVFHTSHPPRDHDRKIDIVYGGRLDYQKQPILMLDFFETLLNKFPSLVIRIYGDGQLANAVDYKINRLSQKFNISREPPVADFTDVLRKSKTFVFTSLYEGLPVVGIEAMKHGAVVMALGAPGINNLVTDGKTGVVRSTISTLSLEAGRIFDSPRLISKLRLGAYLYAKQHFSEKNRDLLISELLNQYDEK